MRVDYNYGYPARMHAPSGWIQDHRFKFIAIQKEFSKDLPPSNISVHVQRQADVTKKTSISLADYVSDFYLRELRDNFKADILSVGAWEIDGIPAKVVTIKYPLTLHGLTREIKSKTILFIINEYVYTLNLASFEKDFEIANKDFESVVKSFHFDPRPTINT